MDSLITAAAHALAVGDPMGALKRIALREDAPALALRGIAMAQLGDFPRAKTLLRSAFRAFGPKEVVARARCTVAEAEIALASRDLVFPAKSLEEARLALESHGDRANAAHARLLAVRHLLLIGQLAAAERMLATFDSSPLPPALRTSIEWIVARIAIRRVQAKAARAALARAAGEARQAGIPALIAEIEREIQMLNAPAARRIANSCERPLVFDEVETLLASDAWIVDACHYVVRHNATVISLASRPVLFALARALAEAWPTDVPRSVLIARAFDSTFADESHRARLRVEMGRLRRVLRPVANLHATKQGFALVPRGVGDVVVLAPPVDEKHAAVLALLADGEAWSSSALALALGAGQRTIQRSLESLALAGRIQSLGQGRARRWMIPTAPEFTTALLLSIPLLVP